MKKLFLFLACCSFSVSLFSQDTIAVVRGFIERGFKDYAFCRCLYYTNVSDSVAIRKSLDKDGSMSGYVNVLELDFSYFDELDSLAARQSNNLYQSKHGNPLVIMKCLDFYKTKELSDYVNSLVDRSYKEWSEPDMMDLYYYKATLINGESKQEKK